VVELLGKAQVKPGELTGIICGAGPGSFTSLRIAASIAKGFASGLGIPLYPIGSLFLIPASVAATLPGGKYVALLDAMRGDFYALSFDVTSEGRLDFLSHTELCSAAQVAERFGGVTQLGPGRAVNVTPHARGAAWVIDRILDAGPADASTWEPDYGRMAEAEVRLRNAGAAGATGATAAAARQ
jgi:tRNA threonylcarbamoyladenosine biosynthesis protein TsaB